MHVVIMYSIYIYIRYIFRSNNADSASWAEMCVLGIVFDVLFPKIRVKSEFIIIDLTRIITVVAKWLVGLL